AAAAVVQDGLRLQARTVGLGGEYRVTFRLVVGSSVLSTVGASPTLIRVRPFDSVLTVAAGGNALRIARRDANNAWTLTNDDESVVQQLADVSAVLPVSVVVDIAAPTLDSRGLPGFAPPTTYGPLSLAPTSSDGFWSTF